VGAERRIQQGGRTGMSSRSVATQKPRS